MMLFSLTPRKLLATLGVFTLLFTASVHAEFIWAPAQPVGSTFPDFVLPDDTGEPRQLNKLGGKHGSLVIFYRSADW